MKFLLGLIIVLGLFACVSKDGRQDMSLVNKKLAKKILTNKNLDRVYDRAKAVVKTGFNAGSGYSEVWIRDYNTFINLSCDMLPRETVKNNLLMFFKFQGKDGNIVDGFVPFDKKTEARYDYMFSDLAPGLAAHKNTVETDQESSLVQAVWKYIKRTGDRSILQQSIDGLSVIDRLDQALQFLINERYDKSYGLLWGATTADWSDIQPEHSWGVYLTDETHYAIDIYDNAMFLIAIENYLSMIGDKNPRFDYWKNISKTVHANVRKYLWDADKKKFIPHIYLNGSPFPEDFVENQIHYHGGTAVAIEAGLLNHEEIEIVNAQMLQNVEASGAPSIGLTLYPPYPAGFFKNKSMYPFGYQNGGDWTWFGGRMIQQLIRNGFVKEAYDELKPMIDRVLKNDGFYEWYTVEGKATGSGEFRGSAGVLATAIEMLHAWAQEASKLKNEDKKISMEELKKNLESGKSFKKEYPFILRKFEPYLNGKWIGNAVSYGCYRKGQAPGRKGPSEAEILEDIKIISKYWNLIRVYNSDDDTERILNVIKEYNLPLKVMVGIWLSKEEKNPVMKKSNIANVLKGIQLANKFKNIVMAVNVGNETQVFWSWHKMNQKSLIRYIRALRNYTTVPVTTADDYNFWNKPESKYVSDEIDFVVTHIYPLWNGKTLKTAITWMDSTYNDIKKIHPKKLLILGETGWATMYNPDKKGPGEQGTLIKGEVSMKAQERYLRMHNEWVNKNKITTFLFEAFDESWKGGGENSGPNEVEKHWGVFYENRRPKESFQNYLK